MQQVTDAHIKTNLEGALKNLRDYPLEFLRLIHISLRGYVEQEGSGDKKFWLQQEVPDAKSNWNRSMRYKIFASDPGTADCLEFKAYHIHVQNLTLWGKSKAYFREDATPGYPLNYTKDDDFSTDTFDPNTWNPNITFFNLPGFVKESISMMITTQLSGCAIIIKPNYGSYDVAHVMPPGGHSAKLMEDRLKMKYPDARIFGKNDYLYATSVIGVLLADGWEFFKQETDGTTYNVGAIS